MTIRLAIGRVAAMRKIIFYLLGLRKVSGGPASYRRVSYPDSGKLLSVCSLQADLFRKTRSIDSAQ